MPEPRVESAQHPTPPGPPGPPTHEHPDGARCMWVRHNFIDRWRLVDATGRDLGPCPGFEQPAAESAQETVPVYRGWVGHPDGSRSRVQRWVRHADEDWISLDSGSRTTGDIMLEVD